MEIVESSSDAMHWKSAEITIPQAIWIGKKE